MSSDTYTCMSSELENIVRKMTTHGYTAGEITNIVKNIVRQTRLEKSFSPTGWRTRGEFVSKAIRKYKNTHPSLPSDGRGGDADWYRVHDDALAYALNAWKVHTRTLDFASDYAQRTPEGRFQTYMLVHDLMYSTRQIEDVWPFIASHFSTPVLPDDPETLRTIHSTFQAFTSSFFKSIQSSLYEEMGVVEISRKVMGLWDKLTDDERLLFLNSIDAQPESVMCPILLRIATL